MLNLNKEELTDKWARACGIFVEKKPKTVDTQALLAERIKHLGPTYSLFYKNPLHLVKGNVSEILFIFKTYFIMC